MHPALRTIAAVSAVLLAATPVLVHAAAVCHCNDHLKHLPRQVQQTRSACCQKTATVEVRERCDRLAAHRCCSEQIVALERGPATIDKRPMADALLVVPACQLTLLAPPARRDSPLASPSRAPPGIATHLQLCILLI